MKRVLQAALPLMITIFFSFVGPCAAAPQETWEKFSLNWGIFFSSIDSSFRLGSGIGISIEPEELLGLDSTNQASRIDASWRFTENRKHRMDLSWFAFRRSGSSVIRDDIILENPDTGESVVIPAGSQIKGNLDIDVFQLAYGYSFLQDDRIDLAAELGLYVMPIDFGYGSSGFVEVSGDAKFTAPLPTIGLRMDVLIAPKWFLRSSAKFFFVEYNQFSGSLVSFSGAVEYNPWEHVGFGVGFDSFGLRLEADGEDYPGVDFRGNLDYGYVGLQLYGRFYF